MTKGERETQNSPVHLKLHLKFFQNTAEFLLN